MRKSSSSSSSIVRVPFFPSPLHLSSFLPSSLSIREKYDDGAQEGGSRKGRRRSVPFPPPLSLSRPQAKRKEDRRRSTPKRKGEAATDSFIRFETEPSRRWWCPTRSLARGRRRETRSDADFRGEKVESNFRPSYHFHGRNEERGCARRLHHHQPKKKEMGRRARTPLSAGWRREGPMGGERLDRRSTRPILRSLPFFLALRSHSFFPSGKKKRAGWDHPA